MKYGKIVKGVFISRPNRFIAHVEVDNRVEIAHVKNTGRCKELLVPGYTVYLSVSDNPSRKTKYDLIATEKQCVNGKTLIINLDSQIPNDVVYEWLKSGSEFLPDATIRREVKMGNSRFDFYVEQGNKKVFIEVKGCTLEENGIARFPDAPTERGIKHLKELTECVKKGYEACVIFVIQMKGVTEFRPNDETHKAFGDALRLAASNGVKVIAMDCSVTPDTINIGSKIKVNLN